MKGAEDLVVGRIITVNGTPLIDDSSWGPEADYLETGHVIPFGSINVFVGFIGGESEDPSQHGDSEEGVAVTVDQEEGSINHESLPLEDEEGQSIEYVLEERLCGGPVDGGSPPVENRHVEGVYRTTEADEGLGMPPGSLAPTPPEATEQAALDAPGVAASAAMTPGVAASGVANRETPPGVATAGSGSRVAPNAAVTSPQGSVLLTPISAVNAAARVTELEATRIGLYDEVQRIADERARLAREEQRLQQEQLRLIEETNSLQGIQATLPHRRHASRLQPGTVNPMELFQ